jgi:hypothetical protein
MEGEAAYRKIEAPVEKRHELEIDRDAAAGAAAEQGHRRLGGDDKLGPRPLRQGARRRAAMRAPIEHPWKPPIDVGEALHKAVGNLGMEKLDRPVASGPVAMRAPRPAIEQRRRVAILIGHRSRCR